MKKKPTASGREGARKPDPRITPELLARAAKARAAAEGPDRADIEQQAHTALREATMANVMATLKAAREKSGISLRELETRTGISRGNLSRLESPASNPTVETLVRYAKAIGRTVTISVK